MNLAQGVPVPSQVLLSKANELMLEQDEEFPRSTQPLAQKWVHQRAQTLQFNWLCLWRQRWGFSVRAMASRNFLLESTLQARVAQRVTGLETFPGHALPLPK